MITYYEIEQQEGDINATWEVIKDCISLKEARKFIKIFENKDKKEKLLGVGYRIIANIRTEVF